MRKNPRRGWAGHEVNRARFLANREARAEARDPDQQALQAIVRHMTNWQRSRWSGAGYPGLRPPSINPKLVEPFTRMDRRETRTA